MYCLSKKDSLLLVTELLDAQGDLFWGLWFLGGGVYKQLFPTCLETNFKFLVKTGFRNKSESAISDFPCPSSAASLPLLLSPALQFMVPVFLKKITLIKAGFFAFVNSSYHVGHSYAFF